jgi:hypothetical protein
MSSKTALITVIAAPTPASSIFVFIAELLVTGFLCELGGLGV